MAKIGWGKWLAGAVAVAAGGAAYVYLKDRGPKPIHELLLAEGAYEIRAYPALLAIETVQHGSRDRALGNGFGLLADYMYGDGREGEPIPMIVPFMAEPASGGSWRVRFLIPEGFTADTLPPLPEGVSVVAIPARQMAAVKIAGKPDDRLFAAKGDELLAWVTAKGRAAAGTVRHAYYNSPLRPGPMRQNEVLVPLVG